MSKTWLNWGSKNRLILLVVTLLQLIICSRTLYWSRVVCYRMWNRQDCTYNLFKLDWKVLYHLMNKSAITSMKTQNIAHWIMAAPLSTRWEKSSICTTARVYNGELHTNSMYSLYTIKYIFITPLAASSCFFNWMNHSTLILCNDLN